jgi:hypothetical protein
MSISLERIHVDAFAGMPQHLLMVDNTIEVEIQNNVRASGGGSRKVWY